MTRQTTRPATRWASRPISRRAILRGAGGAAIALPWLEAMAPGRAQAATGPVKRFVVMFSADGTIPSAWTPTPGASDTDFTLSPILAPLAPHQADIVVIGGLEQKGGGGDGHQTGMGGMLTGQMLNAGPFAGVGAAPAGWPMGPSVDQRIAESLAVPTKLRSLELGVQVGPADNWGRMIYRAANQPLPPEDDPATVYDRVFADLHTDPAVLGRLRKRRQSILGGVGTQLTRISARLGATDRERLDAHLTAVQEIESRLTTDIVASNAACHDPTIMSVAATANDAFPMVGSLQMDLMTMAFACDITRVATLQWSRSVSQTRFSWLNITEGHHDLSHRPDDDAAAVDKLTRINNWYAQQLDRAPEGDARRRGRHAVRRHVDPVVQRAGEGQHAQPDRRALRAGRQRGRRAAHGSLPGLRRPGPAPQQPAGLDPQRDGRRRQHVRQARLVHGTADWTALT
jgi:hypothetical protein